MNAPDTEDTDQQRGHGRQHGEQLRIVFPVERVGVRHIPGEVGVGLRVALPARGQYVGGREPRAAVGGRENVVMAVTVVARGDVGQAERHRFAVIGVAVMLQPVLVAFAAALVAGGFEMAALVRSISCAVWQSVQTGPRLSPLARSWPWTLCWKTSSTVDVALAAGLGDVGVVDRGLAVHAADVVDAVAIVAGRRDDQAHLQQGATVDAFHVLRRSLGVLHLVFAGQPGLAVTLRAGPRQVQLEHRRVRIVDRQDVVRAVTVGTFRRARRAHRLAHAMNAGSIFFGLRFVTTAALRRRQFIGVRQLFDASVAVGA